MVSIETKLTTSRKSGVSLRTRPSGYNFFICIIVNIAQEVGGGLNLEFDQVVTLDSLEVQAFI